MLNLYTQDARRKAGILSPLKCAVGNFDMVFTVVPQALIRNPQSGIILRRFHFNDGLHPTDRATSSSDRRDNLRMPLIGRLLFTFSAIGQSVGAHVTDWSSSHLFNNRWPPHAKFHTGQTLSLSLLLPLLAMLFAWRKTSDSRQAVLATAGFSAAYWVTQATAIAYPNTDYHDPEFATEDSFRLGLPTQAYLEVGFLSIIGLASWLAMRQSVDKPMAQVEKRKGERP